MLIKPIINLNYYFIVGQDESQGKAGTLMTENTEIESNIEPESGNKLDFDSFTDIT